jgi:hypothetical protein
VYAENELSPEILRVNEGFSALFLSIFQTSSWADSPLPEPMTKEHAKKIQELVAIGSEKALTFFERIINAQQRSTHWFVWSESFLKTELKFRKSIFSNINNYDKIFRVVEFELQREIHHHHTGSKYRMRMSDFVSNECP